FDFNTEAQIFSYIVRQLRKLNMHESDAFVGERILDLRREFSDLLRADQQYRKRTLIVIDGLDEAAGWDIGPSLFPLRSSPDIKVLVSARDLYNRSGRDWLEVLGWDTSGVAKWFELLPLSYDKVREALGELESGLAALTDRELVCEKLFH